MRIKKYYRGAIGLAVLSPVVHAAGGQEQGFINDSSLGVLARNYYFNSNNVGPGVAQNQRNEWAQGFIANFQSGFTPGTVGFGIDTSAMLGLKLDSTSSDINTGLLPATGRGVPGVDRAQSEYTKGGVAVKFKVGETVVKYGDQTVMNPVFYTTDSRLLPETTRGMTFVSKDLDKLRIEGGRLDSLRTVSQTDHDSARLEHATYLGGTYDISSALSASLYTSKIDNYWAKNYLGLVYVVPIDSIQAVTFKFDGYHQKSIGDELGGELSNNAYSFNASYAYSAHTFGVGAQHVSGKGKYSWGVDGGDSNYLLNYTQFLDGTAENETSWQLRYDYDFAAWGVPGLRVMAKYVKGTGADSSTFSNGKEWERDLQASYVVQSGQAKGLSFRISQATYRSDFQPGVNEVRVVTEFPISIF